MNISVSGGYFHGYYKGTEYPFYFNGYTTTQADSNFYKKSQTYQRSELYTRAQVDALINGLKARLAALESSSTGSRDWSKAYVTLSHTSEGDTGSDGLKFDFVNIPYNNPNYKFINFSLYTSDLWKHEHN